MSITIQNQIERALTNGTISVGKSLSDVEKASIKNFTNDDAAADQVISIGYYLTVTIAFNETDQEQQATYKLVYASDEAVRKITGQQALV